MEPGSIPNYGDVSSGTSSSDLVMLLNGILNRREAWMRLLEISISSSIEHRPEILAILRSYPQLIPDLIKFKNAQRQQWQQEQQQTLLDEFSAVLKRRLSEEEDIRYARSKMLRPSGAATVLRGLKDMLMSGEDSDVVIKVKDHEFKVHKNILRARSPVFFNMFSHDMVEKKSGVINIDDCEPEAFQEFLNCLYSGEFDTVSLNILFNVYYIGDKYGVEDVKETCIISVLRYLSVETFCGIVTFAHVYGVSPLLVATSEFFVRNLKAIIVTDEWLSFLREHPVTANELHVRAADRYVMREEK